MHWSVFPNRIASKSNDYVVRAKKAYHWLRVGSIGSIEDRGVVSDMEVGQRASPFLLAFSLLSFQERYWEDLKNFD